MRFICLFCIWLVMPVYADISREGDTYSIDVRNERLYDVLEELSTLAVIEIEASADALESQVSLGLSGVSLDKLLSQLFLNQNVMLFRDQSKRVNKIRIFSSAGPIVVNVDKTDQKKPDEKEVNLKERDLNSNTVTANKTEKGYYLDIILNGKAYSMLVDTGANRMTISSDVARQIGVSGQKDIQVTTAGGNVLGSSAKIASLTLAGLNMTDVDVVIMPTLSEDGLIGQNVLRSFKQSIENDTLVLQALSDKERNDPARQKSIEPQPKTH